jgi:N-carbamoylputrescine amidase
MERLHELSPAVVASTRPVNAGKNRLNQGFVWDIKQGYRPAHHKYYLPEEEGFREATWFNQGAKEFLPIQIGKIKMGFLICTELWFMQQARDYGQQGIHLLITPRASGIYTEKWLVGGRAAGVISGAFSLSSNHFDPGGTFGGQGWVVSPDGQVLGLTSQNQPFITVEIDLDEAERAKQTYPRNVLD